MTARRPTSQHRLHAWFAIAILLLGALAPSISAAVSHARGDSTWQEICRSPASRADAQKTTQNAALDALMMGHCALCHLHAADVILPLAPTALVLRQDLQFAMPERFYSAPSTAHAWRAAPARAPPLSA